MDGPSPPRPTDTGASGAARETAAGATAGATGPAHAAAARPAPSLRHELTDSQPPRCPPEMALIEDLVCVDRWEAGLVQWQPTESESPWSPHETPLGANVRIRATSRAGVVPQGHISGQLAQAACVRSGKRLCTAREWERACGGSSGWTYPYGPERQSHTCNDDGRAVHPVVEAARRMGLPTERMWYEGMDAPLINQLPDTVRPTGTSSRCASDYGTYDMVGNLHEWIEDPAGTFRGGFYMDTRINGEGCRYATTAHGFSYHDYSTGFRCCLDPDPVE